jgi:hypothetical protein
LNEAQKVIGFDRKVRLAWLDATADWAARGLSAEEIRSKLDLLLEGEIAGKEALKKTKTVLLRIWVLVPEYLRPLRDEGLGLLPHLSDPGRLALHWGMSLAAYPLLRDTATVVGRLLDLQEKVTASQIRLRLAENYGERSTLLRAIQRITSSFVDWGALRKTGREGVFVAGPSYPIEDERLAAWLIEALLLGSESDSGVLPALMKNPALFPFEIGRLNRRFFEGSSRLELYRQGLDEDLVALRTANAG